MTPPSFFTGADKERVENFLKAGLSYRQIAEQFSCNKDTVSKFVRTHLPEWHARYTNHHSRPAVGLKILTIDIETKPGLTYFWHTNERFIRPEYVIRDTTTYSFAAKWLDSNEVEFWSDFKQGHSAMISRAHTLLTAADGVVTYNGDGFDLPHLNLEILRNGAMPPAPFKSIDLLKTIRKRFRFTNNRLQRVSKTLGIGAKIEHEGFIPLLEKCEAGDTSAQHRLQEYNVNDVILTEDLYQDILPWIEGHPSYAAYSTDQVCPNDGGELEERGYYRTKTGTYKRYQCTTCGKWTRDTHRSFRTEITETALS